MAGEDRHFLHSTLRERIFEHVFVGDVLRTLWKRGVTDVEILRPEFDAHGYDVVMSRGPIVRDVQLKTQAAGKVSVGRALAEKPSGCVVWIGLNKETLDLGPLHVVWWIARFAVTGHLSVSKPQACNSQRGRCAPYPQESSRVAAFGV